MFAVTRRPSPSYENASSTAPFAPLIAVSRPHASYAYSNPTWSWVISPAASYVGGTAPYTPVTSFRAFTVYDWTDPFVATATTFPAPSYPHTCFRVKYPESPSWVLFNVPRWKFEIWFSPSYVYNSPYAAFVRLSRQRTFPAASYPYWKSS